MGMRCGLVWIGFVLCCCSLGCGESDLQLGTSEEASTLRIGKGGSNLTFGDTQSGGGVSGSREVEDTTVRGNVFDLRPPTVRPIAVFVYVDLRDPGTFQEFTDAEVGLVEEDQTFLVADLAAGTLTVVFLLDEVGVNQDGMIDPGDPVAFFQDLTGRLQNLSENTDVLLEDVDVTFSLSAPDTGTATVESQANIIVTQKPLPSDLSSDSSS